MELTPELLIRHEWTDVSRDVRMKFRRDGTGWYERESAPDRPFVHENLLWRIEGEVLQMKFAHARLWTEVPIAASEGVPSDDGRYGQRRLSLARDPYARTLEERQTPALLLESDRGAALP